MRKRGYKTNRNLPRSVQKATPLKSVAKPGLPAPLQNPLGVGDYVGKEKRSIMSGGAEAIADIGIP